ncbi:hypothetical protein D3C85_1794150 [compost metagenome]
MPGEVAKAFVAVWQQAIHLAQVAMEQTLSEQRHVLDDERERLAAVEDQARQDLAKGAPAGGRGRGRASGCRTAFS